MMNSSRARPTPSLGRSDSRKASSGLPTFIMIWVLGRRSCRRSSAATSNSSRPVVDEARFPLGAGDGDLLAVAQHARCRVSVPTTAGTPSSRLTMAAWQVRPPRLVTMAAAFFMVGSQSGSVLSVTSTSPVLELMRDPAPVLITRTGPRPIFSPTLRPRDQHRPLDLEAVDLDRSRPASATARSRDGPGR